jgi:hypothetical protein
VDQVRRLRDFCNEFLALPENAVETKSPLLAVPNGTILLTLDEVTDGFLDYLEAAGIPDPGDDLEFVVITDLGRIESSPEACLEWVLKDAASITPLIRRATSFGNDFEWYKVEFSDGWKAVGICQH